MGLDLLDFAFRIEKQLRVKIGSDDFRSLESAWAQRTPPDTTAGALHDWVVRLCEAKGANVPHSSWSRVRLELAKVVGKPPQIIHRDTLVIRDLGFS